MRNLATTLGALGITLVLAGCPIWIETEDVENPPDCGWGCAPECACDNDCAEGYWCNDGSCDATWYCEHDGSCPSGFICDDRDTCVPDPNAPTACDGLEDCAEGYCGDDGFCVDTGACGAPEDCSVYGPGLTCDDRGVCVPDEGPCPDGECGCSDDSECDTGNLCINSRCTDLMTICVFDFECGDGACINNECHMDCSMADTPCPVGQACVAGTCLDLVQGADECVFDEDCGTAGDFRCVNATCHPTCETAESCGVGETCRSGVCRADTAPIRDCTMSEECGADMVCLRGKCRLPCAADVNCGEGASHCGPDNFCLFEEELTPPECQRASDCDAGASCNNGACSAGL